MLIILSLSVTVRSALYVISENIFTLSLSLSCPIGYPLQRYTFAGLNIVKYT